MNLSKRYSVSKLTILVLLGIFTFMIFNQGRFKKEKAVIEWDVIGYYAYLPALFIYNDLTLNFMDGYNGPHKFRIWPNLTKGGKKYIKYTMGLSFLYAPFFFIGHAAASIFSYDAGGYTMPYKLALQLGGGFYVFMGLIILRKIVKKWFSELTTTSILIILALGTNLFYYATIENTMPHGYNFFLIIMFVYFTILFYENDRKKYKNAIVLGLLFGLISLIRPTNSLVIFIFIFYGVYAWSGIKNRILFLFNKPTYILLIGSLTLLIWFPQMLYWHSITGKWLYFSYGSAETFNFLKPHVIEGLFSYRKGWFLYSTIFIFMFPGLWLLKQYVKNFTIGILVLFPLFIYVTFSWWCWWYGGYSSRPMVDMYGIFAIPLAAFLEYTYRIKNKIFKYGILVVLLFFTWKGSFGNFQYQTQAIHLDGMTKEAFWSSYLRLHPPHGFCEKLCRPDIEFAKKHIEVCHPMKL